MDSRTALPAAPRRVSQDSLRLCRCAPSPITPGSSSSASARCFLDDGRLRHLRKGGHYHWCNEAESGSRTLGSHLRCDGRSARSLVGPARRTDPFRALGCPPAPDRSYMRERAIHMADTSQSARVARVTLAHRSHRVTETHAPRLRSGRPEQSRRTESVPLIRWLPCYPRGPFVTFVTFVASAALCEVVVAPSFDFAQDAPSAVEGRASP
jgi:hypothetical protein